MTLTVTGSAPVRPSELLRTKRELIVDAVRAHGVTNPRVIGSVARGTDTDQSDLDLLVSVPRGAALAFLGLGEYLTNLLGLRVDVVSEGGLRAANRHILDEAVPL